MASIIEMPKLSDTMTTGTLAKWLKKEGEAVHSGDMIASVETDKATMEVECFDDGIILKTFVNEGDSVPVGAPMCVVGAKGEAIPGATDAAPAPKADDNKAAPAEAETANETAPAANERIKASPLAKKVAAEKGVNISTLTGTGPGGRIVRADVEASATNGASAMPESTAPAQTAKPVAPAKPAAQAPAPIPFASGEAPADTVIKVGNMRATIARRLVEAKATIPHFYLEMEVDIAPLLALRQKLNEGLEKEGVKFTVNDLLIKAAVEALRRVPSANASWQGDKIIQYGAVHIAFAVAIEEGLVTPTIRDADRKSLRQIAAEAKVLAVKARERKLTPAEMTGNTFTLSNLGMFGITNFFGIVNPPNGAILCIGATVKKPVVNERDEIVVGQRMNLGLSCDHRVVDGAVGAKYLAALKLLIETPELMLA
jgi:pyruvate dehydrogenase E2 component (dihydrolipoamide acetyltransferase)